MMEKIGFWNFFILCWSAGVAFQLGADIVKTVKEILQLIVSGIYKMFKSSRSGT